MFIFNKDTTPISHDHSAKSSAFSSLSGLKESIKDYSSGDKQLKKIALEEIFSSDNLIALSKPSNARYLSEFKTFVANNKNEVALFLSGPSNDDFIKLPSTIKTMLENLVSKKIDSAKLIIESENTGIKKLTSKLRKINQRSEAPTSKDVKDIRESSKEYEKEIRDTRRQLRLLENIPNRTIEQEISYVNLKKELSELRDAYKEFKDRANKNKIDTGEMDNFFVNVELFTRQELSVNNNGIRSFSTNHVEEADSSANVGASDKLLNSITKDSYLNTLQKIRDMIKDSSVKKVLDELKKFEKEIEKIDKKKAEDRSKETKLMAAKLEKNINELKIALNKRVEMKNELIALSKRDDISSETKVDIQNLIQTLNDPKLAKNIIALEKFKTQLEANNYNLKDFAELSKEMIDVEEKSIALLKKFFDGQGSVLSNDKNIIPNVASIVAGATSQIKKEPLAKISERLDATLEQIQRKLGKSAVTLFVDIHSIKDKLNDFLEKFVSSNGKGSSDEKGKQILNMIEDITLLMKSGNYEEAAGMMKELEKVQQA